MTEVSLHLFQLVLACFWLALPFTAAQELAAMFEDGARVDAELNQYETFIFAGTEASPRSKIFSSCLDSERPSEVELYSIEATGGKEFFRFLPDDESLQFEVGWSPVTDVEISSIVDCADAAAEKGSSMFKYEAGACNVSSRLYDIDRPATCEDSVNEVVFVLPGSTPCPLPLFDVSADPTDPYCAKIYATGGINLLYDLMLIGCSSTTSYHFIEDPRLISMASLRQLLLDQGIDHDLGVAAISRPEENEYKYFENYATVNVADMIGGVMPELVSGRKFMVMSAADGLFLRPAYGVEVIGYNICVLNFQP